LYRYPGEVREAYSALDGIALGIQHTPVVLSAKVAPNLGGVETLWEDKQAALRQHGNTSMYARWPSGANQVGILARQVRSFRQYCIG